MISSRFYGIIRTKIRNLLVKFPSAFRVTKRMRRNIRRLMDGYDYDQQTSLRTMSSDAFRHTLRYRSCKANSISDLNDTMGTLEAGKCSVAVLGNYAQENIGGQLTVLAAYKIIESLGFSVKVVKFKDHFLESPKRKIIWEYLCNFTNADADTLLSKINDEADAFVTCSDWTFHKTWSKGWDFYQQSWTADNKNRISFAASFGSGGGYLEEDYPELKSRLNRFRVLSIREPSGISFVNTIGIKNAIFMHDPVFAHNRQFYHELSEIDAEDRPLLKSLVHGKYMMVYLRDYTEEKVQFIVRVASKLLLKPLVIVGYRKEAKYVKKFHFSRKKICYLLNVTMCEWLWFLEHSEFVLTDSFHATCFCLIMNKPFITFRRSNPGLFSKLSTLCTNANLADRLLSENAADVDINRVIDSQIGWNDVNDLLNKWYLTTRNFIKEALQAS